MKIRFRREVKDCLEKEEIEVIGVEEGSGENRDPLEEETFYDAVDHIENSEETELSRRKRQKRLPTNFLIISCNVLKDDEFSKAWVVKCSSHCANKT